MDELKVNRGQNPRSQENILRHNRKRLSDMRVRLQGIRQLLLANNKKIELDALKKWYSSSFALGKQTFNNDLSHLISIQDIEIKTLKTVYYKSSIDKVDTPLLKPQLRDILSSIPSEKTLKEETTDSTEKNDDDEGKNLIEF